MRRFNLIQFKIFELDWIGQFEFPQTRPNHSQYRDENIEI